jgi:predicted nuclease with TOPRIM domain
MDKKTKRPKNRPNEMLGRRYTRLLASLWINTIALLISFSLANLLVPRTSWWAVAIATMLATSLVRYVTGGLKSYIRKLLELARKWLVRVASEKTVADTSGEFFRITVLAVLAVAIFAVVFAYSFIAFGLLRWMPDWFPSLAALILSAEVVCAALVPRRLAVTVAAHQRKRKRAMRERSHKRKAERDAELAARIQAARQRTVTTSKPPIIKHPTSVQAFPIVTPTTRRKIKLRRIHKYKRGKVPPSVNPAADVEKISRTLEEIKGLQERLSSKPEVVPRRPQTIRDASEWQAEIAEMEAAFKRLDARASYLDTEAQLLTRRIEREGFNPTVIAEGLAIFTEWAETLEALLDIQKQLVELEGEYKWWLSFAQEAVGQLESKVERIQQRAEELRPQVSGANNPLQYVVTIKFKPEEEAVTGGDSRRN